MMIDIVPNAECYFADLYQVLDTVAREKKYLAFTEAPSLQSACAFYQNIVENKWCQYLAVVDHHVVGWCDILPVVGQARSHVGVMGIGLLPSFRHQELGSKLLTSALSDAWAQKFTRIELTVREDNVNAIRLYERFGFVKEGNCRRFMCIDKEYFDAICMSLLKEDVLCG